jgi:CHAD domain-containing protein
VRVRELELKFSVHEPFTLPDVAADGAGVARVEPTGKATLRATYYDTEDLRLAREGITLRRRTGGSDAGWHLKLPLLGDHPGARDEIAAPLGAGRGVPPELRELVMAFVRTSRLQPVATLRTVRETFRLLDGQGAVVAELVDDTVSVLDGTHVVERFREIEVESTGAGIQILETVGAQLVAAGAVAGNFMPKAIRALGSRATLPPEPEPPEQVDPKSTAGQLVTAFLRTHVRALMAQDPRVRQDLPDAVHQMRVAARRLRSGLKTFKTLVDQEWATGVRDELRWLASSLGEVRDTEVLLARFVKQLEQLPDADLTARAVHAVETRLQSSLDHGAEDIRAALTSQRYLKLLDTVVAGAQAPPLTAEADGKAGDVLPPLARTAWRKLAKALDHVDEGTPDEELHQARILAKQARYTCEACALAFGKPAKRLATEITRLQDVLGEHQDAVVAAETVERMAGEPRAARDLVFSLGVLYTVQLDAAADARSQLETVWQEVDRQRYRRWLGN